MAVWNGTVTTQLGLNLITKVMAGRTSLSFTGFKTSDGSFSGVELKSMVSLSNVKQEFNVSNVNIQNSTTVLVKGVITNTGLSNQYLLNAVGLYATDPDLGEILFSVTTADIADVIPAKTNTNTTSLILNVLTSVTDANRVTLSLSQPAIVTTDMLEIYIKNTDLATEAINGTSKIATQPEVNNGLEDTKIVTSKKLKARLDSLLAGVGTTFVKLTQLATENIAGIIKISTTAQVSAGTDNSTAISPAKLFEAFANLKTTNGYQKFPNGAIIQWGLIAYNAPSNTPGDFTFAFVNFPIAFPTKMSSITFSGFNDAKGDNGLKCQHSCENSSKSGIDFRATRLVGTRVPGSQGNAYYIAIGY